MKYNQENLENFLLNSFELIDITTKNFGGKHKFTSKTCFQSGKYEVVLWKNSEKFYIIAGEKGRLEKVFFSNNGTIEVCEEKELDEIFLHAQLNKNLKTNKDKKSTLKI